MRTGHTPNVTSIESPQAGTTSPSPLPPSALFDLTGRVVLVTGASSGLGLRFAQAAHAAGADVVVCARRIDQLREAVGSLDRALALQCDIGVESDIEQLAAEVLQRYGRVDVLVNNAGTHYLSPAETEPLAEFRRVVDVNLVGLFSLTQKVAVSMLDAGRGSIINIASTLGLVASAPNNQASYCATKGAVINLTRELAVQWASRGVRVNCIAPGVFPSELTEFMLGDEPSMKWLRRNTPMRRPGAQDELDGAMIFLASDASSFITGHTLTVDGGWTAR